MLAPVANLIEICPLLHIQPLPIDQHQWHSLSQQPPDILIFISPAAAQFGVDLLPRHIFNHAKVISVGAATAKQLSDAGISDIETPLVETSEGLLELTSLHHVAQKRIVIVRGNGGRELLHEQLTDRGANVTYTEVYQRQWLTLSEQQTIDKWRKQKINCIVVTSSQLLEKTLSLIDDLAFANQCSWIVVSQRCKQRAEQLGLKKVINSQGASHTSILASITEQLTENTHDK